MPTLTTTIEHGGEEIEVVVEYEYFKGSLGHRGSFGEPLEPDESPQVEISYVRHKGYELEIDDKTLCNLEEQCLENEAKQFMSYE